MTSSTSGIQVTAELRSQFERARKGGSTALIKVQIVNDTLDCVKVEPKSSVGSNWSRDFDLVARVLDADVPCFIIFFKTRDEMLLLQYVPEDASVKHKMSYSSSKGALNSLMNARQFGSAGNSFGSSKAVEQYFATSKKEMSYASYAAHTNTTGPMSEVEEALSVLPKEISRKEFGKSMGYSLLATVSGKALPPQLKDYAAGGGNAPQTSTNLFKGGAHNFHAKPSDAKAANAASRNGVNVNKPAGASLPGWGATSPSSANNNNSSSSSSFSGSNPSSNKSFGSNNSSSFGSNGNRSTASASPTATPASSPASATVAASAASAASPASSPTAASASSAASSSSTPAASSSFGAAGRPQPTVFLKCLVSSCERKRFKNGYCADCLQSSAERREAIFGGTTTASTPSPSSSPSPSPSPSSASSSSASAPSASAAASEEKSKPEEKAKGPEVKPPTPSTGPSAAAIAATRKFGAPRASVAASPAPKKTPEPEAETKVEEPAAAPAVVEAVAAEEPKAATEDEEDMVVPAEAPAPPTAAAAEEAAPAAEEAKAE